LPGIDYIGPEGLDAALRRWLAALASYGRKGRPVGTPRRSALLVLDLQQFFCDERSHAHLPAVRAIAPAVHALIEGFRSAGSPVIFTRHAADEGDDPGRMGDWWADLVAEGTEASQLAPWVPVRADDTVLRKTRYDAFLGTDLSVRLEEADVDTLVVAGVATHLCCETTARSAFQRGFHVLIAADATASQDEALHVGALRSLAHGFAHVLPASQLLRWRAGAAGIAPPEAARTRWDEVEDVVVAGAGPAGLAAAVQAKRMGLRVVLVEARQVGGLLRQANRVENYLGGGVHDGPDLVAALAAQAAALGVEPVPGTVGGVEAVDGCFVVSLGDGKELAARCVILATGTEHLAAGFPGERTLAADRLHHGVRELLDRAAGPGHAAVVGGGDAAYDQAITLKERGWEVSILQRGARPRALQRLERRAQDLGISVRAETSIVSAERTAQGVLVRWRTRDGEGTLAVDRLLVAVGRGPRHPRVVDGRVPGSRRLIEDVAGLKTIPGLHPIGDLARGRFRQASMAAGDGVEAAMKVFARIAAEGSR